ncbi:hypothetical protein VB779_09475 [Haloarculaceae archaeon H-GB11]|nr:hypothetical protein [Haloarculaceae archaeon H-GB11]
MGVAPTSERGQQSREHVPEIVGNLPLEETSEIRRAATDICEAVDRRKLLNNRPARVVAAGAVYVAIRRLRPHVGHVPKGEVAAAADCTVCGVESAWRAIGNGWSDLRGVDQWS